MTGLLMGTSWGESAVEDLGWANFGGRLSPVRDIKFLTNVSRSQPMIDSVVSTLTPGDMLNGAMPYSKEVTTDYGKTFVDIIEVVEPGLRIRVVIMVPELDFIEQVRNAQVRSLAGTAAAIVATVVIAFLVSIAITAPLINLRDRMAMCASFDDEDPADPPSILSEVADMQDSYETMRGALNRAKKFLPMAVLVGAADEEDDDEEEECTTQSGSRKQTATDKSLNSYGASNTKIGRANDENRSMRSMRSHRSNRSSKNSKGSIAAIPLNTECGLNTKRVSVLAFNLTGLYTIRRDAGATKMMAAHKQFIEIITNHVRANKGYIDSFSGDHVMCSFNAVNNIVACSRRAAAAMVSTFRDFNAKGIKATCGMSTGLCLVGNMGSDDMKRFCIIGDAMTNAMQLERLCKAYGVDHLTLGSGMVDINTHYAHEAIDIVMFGKSAGKSATEIVVTIKEREQGELQEWMYELQEADKSDSKSILHTAFDALLRGNREAAAAALESFHALQTSEEAGKEEGSHITPKAVGNIELLLADTTSTTPVSDFGRYYVLL